MPKDAAYHEAAIQYNDELADFAKALAARLEHPTVAGWARAVENQHRFHSSRHQNAIRKLEGRAPNAVENTEDGGEDRAIVDREPDTDEQIVHRSAESGQFVSEEEAEENPATTVRETVDIPRAAGDAMSPFEVAQNEQKEGDSASE